MRNLIFLGAPGSGKGTQSADLVKSHNYYQLSTGEILREMVNNNDDDLSNKVKTEMAQGRLISDEIIFEIIKRKILELKEKNIQGIIFDGFPRTILQAKELEHILLESSLKIDAVIELKIDSSVLVKRITGRYTCAGCKEGYNKYFKPTKEADICDVCGGTAFITRKDDIEETVLNRIKIYEDQTKPLTDYYLKKDVLFVVDGQRSMDLIASDVNLILNNL